MRDLAAVPAGRRDWVHTKEVHGVNLLKRTVLGLDDEEEDNEHEGNTASGEDQTVKVVNRTSDEPSEEGDNCSTC